MEFTETRIDRRRFLKAAGFAACALALGGGGLAAAGLRRPHVKFVERTCGEEPGPGKRMKTGRILVAYASRAGSTGGVANEIAEAFCDAGNVADVRLAKRVKSLKPYKAVIAGSPIYDGRWLPEAFDFVDGFGKELGALPVSFFTVSLAMVRDTRPRRREAEAALAPALEKHPGIRPLAVGHFAGAFIPANLPTFDTLTLKLTGAPAGDHRDWLSIRAWADIVRGIMDGIYPAYGGATGVDNWQQIPCGKPPVGLS